ncbi:hypothetical protein CXF83_11355 [Shewanella sp. Choline-02u-19]|nr:hypothetical protein CXF84_14720 [Shewanella sp. Bg11-22]PKI27282.1 hypothetical protein CXF83_11355 [Shewanella sp. Choline-02u-19]
MTVTPVTALIMSVGLIFIFYKISIIFKWIPCLKVIIRLDLDISDGYPDGMGMGMGMGMGGSKLMLQ